jgi:hypothetical protein
MHSDRLGYRAHWVIHRYADEGSFAEGKPLDVSNVPGNMLLNEGIAELLDLLCGLGTPTQYGSATAHIGVGDSAQAENASQTGLQAVSNKVYRPMATGYPLRVGQSVTFRSVFGADDANFEWRELTVANGNSDAARNLNRKATYQGTKASGQVWVLDLSIILS